VAPSEWRFTTSEHGKPSIIASDREPRSITFNLSHTRGLVACAVAGGARIGVDVERVRPMPDLLDIARRHFARSEARSLEGMTSPDRERRFAELWTLKESYVKAIGDGLAAPLDTFAFDLDDRPGLRFSAGIDASNWHFVLTAPTEDTRLAVAVDRRGTEPGDRIVFHCATPTKSAGETLRIVAESENGTCSP
jgi:4'-phosphopantetheinyl transferase